MTNISGTSGMQNSQLQLAEHESVKPGHFLAKETKAELADVESKYVNRMDDLKSQLASTNNPGEQVKLEVELKSLEQKFESFKETVEALSKDVRRESPLEGQGSIDARNGISQAMHEFRSELSQSYSNIGIGSAPPPEGLTRVIACPVGAPAGAPSITAEQMRTRLEGVIAKLEAKVPRFVNSGFTKIIDNLKAQIADLKAEAKGTGGTGSAQEPKETKSTESAAASESSKKTGTSEYDKYKEMDPSDVAHAMSKDPDAFWKDMGNMSMEERTDVQSRLQMHLQQVNQMFTMMSQMSQSMHDTSKAIINNLRV